MQLFSVRLGMWAKAKVGANVKKLIKKLSHAYFASAYCRCLNKRQDYVKRLKLDTPCGRD